MSAMRDLSVVGCHWFGDLTQECVLVKDGIVALAKLRRPEVRCRVAGETPEEDDSWEEECWSLSVKQGKRQLFHTFSANGRLTSGDIARQVAEAIVAAVSPPEDSDTQLAVEDAVAALKALSNESLVTLLIRAGENPKGLERIRRGELAARAAAYVRKASVRIQWREGLPAEPANPPECSADPIPPEIPRA